LDAGIFTEIFMKEEYMKLTNKGIFVLLNRAREIYHNEHEGNVEIDEVDADNEADAISASENIDDLIEANGVYVKAWVWLSFNELSEAEKKTVLGQNYDKYVKRNQ
jgi:hypothetical protein